VTTVRSHMEQAAVHGEAAKQFGIDWFASDSDRYAHAQLHATLALAEETARLADAQETANLLTAFAHDDLLSHNERMSIHGRIGAALVDGRHA
jgi:hypothetical protein